MEIVKKNLVSILCGVVAIIALVALFYPLGGKVQELKTDLTSRAGLYSTLDGLRTKPRNLPVIDPEHPTQEPLGRFPNDEIVKQGQAIPAAYQAEALQIVQTADKVNRHDTLIPNVLPNPNQISLLQFRDAYHPAFDAIRRQILRAGYPPNPEEIRLATEALWTNNYAPQLIIVGGRATNETAVRNAFQAESVNVPRNERLRVAQSSMMYCEPLAFTLSAAQTLQPTNAQAGVPTISELFFAQLGLWIQQDVAKAIARTNATSGAKNVYDAPVKHLVKIDIPQAPFVLPPTYAPGTEITGDAKAALPKEPTLSPTGHVSNGMYYAVRYEFTVNMEADKIPWLIYELGNRNFITVLSMNVRGIDVGVQNALGFHYFPAGVSRPVAQVTFRCEQLLLRDWLNPLMPADVAKNLGTPGAAPGGGMMSPEDMMGAPPRF